MLYSTYTENKSARKYRLGVGLASSVYFRHLPFRACEHYLHISDIMSEPAAACDSTIPESDEVFVQGDIKQERKFLDYCAGRVLGRKCSCPSPEIYSDDNHYKWYGARWGVMCWGGEKWRLKKIADMRQAALDRVLAQGPFESWKACAEVVAVDLHDAKQAAEQAEANAVQACRLARAYDAKQAAVQAQEKAVQAWRLAKGLPALPGAPPRT